MYLNTFVDSAAKVTHTLLVVAGVELLVIKHEALVVEALSAELASVSV